MKPWEDSKNMVMKKKTVNKWLKTTSMVWQKSTYYRTCKEYWISRYMLYRRSLHELKILPFWWQSMASDDVPKRSFPFVPKPEDRSCRWFNLSKKALWDLNVSSNGLCREGTGCGRQFLKNWNSGKNWVSSSPPWINLSWPGWLGFKPKLSLLVRSKFGVPETEDELLLAALKSSSVRRTGRLFRWFVSKVAYSAMPAGVRRHASWSPKGSCCWEMRRANRFLLAVRVLWRYWVYHNSPTVPRSILFPVWLYPVFAFCTMSQGKVVSVLNYSILHRL